MVFLNHFALLVLVSVTQGVAALWPIPRSLSAGTTALRLSPSFSINVNVPNTPSDLMDAVSRAKTSLFGDQLQRLVVGRGINDTQRIKAAKVLSSINLSITGTRPVQSIMSEATLPMESRSEGYSLKVPSDGSSATLTADSTLGLFRGYLS